MSQAVAIAPAGTAIIEDVLIRGDLAKLSPEQRSHYYMEVCRSVGLNPLTKPFEYISLNNKLTLYALRTCTDQLRTIHGVSVEDLIESERDGVFIVTAKVRNKEGRTDMAKGAVPIATLKGEALANAMMKAETKAKRRATLSVCGLGFLDESEVESIPAAVRQSAPATSTTPTTPTVPHDPTTGEVKPCTINIPLTRDEKDDWIGWGGRYIAALKQCQSRAECEEWVALNIDTLAECLAGAPKAAGSVQKAIAATRERLPETIDAEPEASDFMPAGEVETV